MFVRYFTEIALPFEDVEAQLLASPDAWLPGLASDAGVRGETLLADVGFGPTSRRLGRTVRVDLGAPTHFPTKTLIPMSWKVTSAEALFPSLESDVEIAPLGPRRTQISISARYRPPLGLVGRALDRALLHRVAEATVKDFLDRVRDRVEAAAVAAAQH